MANTAVSYKGMKCYLNTDSTNVILSTKAEKIYLNENISDMFYNCRNLLLNLDSLDWNYDLVKYMSRTFLNCYNLKGSPVCGNNVTNMAGAYYSCKLTGSPVCGDNVTNMAAAYQSCRNLTGSPVCGNNVIDMAFAYQSCRNLTGSPVCGDNVIDMAYAYSDCYNLYGNMNISSFTNKSSSESGLVKNLFYLRDTSNRLNIFVPYGSNNIFNILQNANTIPNSITGSNFNWILDLSNDRFYNASVNIYVYGGNASV